MPTRPAARCTSPPGTATTNQLWTIDAEGRLVAERSLGDTNRRTTLALGSDGRRLFLGRDVYSDYAVEVLNLENGQQVAEIALSSAPYTMLWARSNRPALGRLHVREPDC